MSCEITDLMPKHQRGRTGKSYLFLYPVPVPGGIPDMKEHDIEWDSVTRKVRRFITKQWSATGLHFSDPP